MGFIQPNKEIDPYIHFVIAGGKKKINKAYTSLVIISLYKLTNIKEILISAVNNFKYLYTSWKYRWTTTSAVYIVVIRKSPPLLFFPLKFLFEWK